MSFSIQFMHNKSEFNVVDKEVEEVLKLDGTLRNECNLSMPDILVELPPGHDFRKINYCYIEYFGRYYHITDITYKRNSLAEIHLKCDVLMSFKDDIKSSYGICSRNSERYHTYLNDSNYKVYQNRVTSIYSFADKFNDTNFVLTVAGS